MLKLPFELGRFPRVISLSILTGLLIGFPIGQSLKIPADTGTTFQWAPLVGAGQAPHSCGTIYPEPAWQRDVSRTMDEWIHAGFECPAYSRCNHTIHRKFEQTMTPQANEKFKKMFGSIGAERGKTKIFCFQQVFRGGCYGRMQNGLFYDSFPLQLTALESSLPYYNGSVQFTIKKIGAEFLISDFTISNDRGNSFETFLKSAREAKFAPISEKAVRLFASRISDPIFDQTEVKYFNELSGAIQLNPSFALAYRQRAMMNYNRGNRIDAIADLSNVLNLMPHYYPALIARGRAYYEVGELDKSYKDLNKALMLAPKSYRAKNCRAETLMRLRRYSDAISDLKNCIEKIQFDSNNFINLGETFELSGDSKNAFKNYDEAVIIQSTPTLQSYAVDADIFENDHLTSRFSHQCERSALLFRGHAHHRAKQYELACADFKAVLKNNPDLADKAAAHVGIARTRIGKDHNWIIMAEYDKNMRKHQNQFFGHAGRGILLFELNDFASAETEFSAAIKLNPKIASLYRDRAQCRIELNNLAGAKVDANLSLSLNSSCTESLDSLGIAYLKQNEPEKALAYFNKAIEIDDKYTGTYRRRGNAQRQLHNFNEAFTDYDKSIALDPTNYKAFFDKGTLYAQLGKDKEAKKEYKKALKANPNCRFKHFELWFI